MTVKRLVGTSENRHGKAREGSSESAPEPKPEPKPEPEPEPEPDVSDLRSPLERFRTKPKKPLSVTDLVSPSWCELQYWYNLTKYGRKRRTPAMKQGSVVHKKLEDQVHQAVAVDIHSKEDAWGLRIWNIIQGLQTLRETGMTRELEVWGIIDGEIVNGVIDELSYICPDRELEKAADPAELGEPPLPANQSSITQFLKQYSNNISDDSSGVLRDVRSVLKKTSRIYITDVKTRGVKTIPKGASFRPTVMQLMLYHRLLSDLIAHKTDPNILFDRYSLQPTRPFSDAFIAQIAALNETFYDGPSQSPSTTSPSPPSSPPLKTQHDTIDLLLMHNSLHQLWTLLTHEIDLTFPHGAASLGPVLKAEYRAQTDGAVLGMKTFLHDDDVMDDYLEDGMRWWKGEREARGVCVEEAYKCGVCEFADGCDWRREKVEEATRAHRARRSRSVV